jgi:hypothetical protein
MDLTVARRRIKDWSARSAGSRLKSIFFGKPCGESGDHASRATGMA